MAREAPLCSRSLKLVWIPSFDGMTEGMALPLRRDDGRVGVTPSPGAGDGRRLREALHHLGHDGVSGDCECSPTHRVIPAKAGTQESLQAGSTKKSRMRQSKTLGPGTSKSHTCDFFGRDDNQRSNLAFHANP